MLFVDVEKIALYASEILQEKALCQQDPDEDEEDRVEGESSEYESALISNASDLVGALASVLGADFAQPFGQFLPLIKKFYVRFPLFGFFVQDVLVFLTMLVWHFIRTPSDLLPTDPWPLDLWVRSSPG